MFNSSVIAQLKKVIGWRDFWDLTEIPTLGSPLNDSESGQYFQDFSPALRLDYISSLLAPNRLLTDYLDEVETQSITQVLNRVETEKQIQNVGRDIARSDIVFNVARKTANITNEGRFVGVAFELKQNMGLTAIINKIGLYLTAPVTDLDIYLFHSTQEAYIATYQFTSTTTNSFSWIEQEIQMAVDSGSITGGTWYVGYYQDDLAAQGSAAVQYTSMNWMNGYCNTCGQSSYDVLYKSISTHLTMMGFYQPAAVVGSFDPDLAVKTNSSNWGFNFNISIVCDLSRFWIDNRRNLVNLIGLQVAISVLEMMKFSDQINNIEEAVKIMIIRDLEGTNDTGLIPLWKRLDDAISALILDNGNLAKECLPCARKPKTSFGGLG